jgi:hypothetical protein
MKALVAKIGFLELATGIAWDWPSSSPWDQFSMIGMLKSIIPVYCSVSWSGLISILRMNEFNQKIK